MTKRQVSYFTDSGDFGHADGLIRIDTTKWTREDWTRIVMCDASLRKKIAMQIEHIHKEQTQKEKDQ